MKIAFFELEGWEEDRIRSAFPDADIFLSADKLGPDSLPERRDFEAVSVFVNSEVTADVIARFPELRLVATRSTGFDHVDVGACRAREISVAYVPGYGDHTVAEYAFGLVLNLTRRIFWAIDQVRETGSFSQQGLRGLDLKDKIIGVIGTGRIGREMIRMAKGFGMEVVATDPFPNQSAAAELAFRYVSLEELLAISDIISIHCPFNAETRHLINRSNIDLIKKSAYLVNTARGGIVETDALVHALRSGILAGAALDVLEEEGDTRDELHLLQSHPKEEELKTILENHMLMKMPNVLVTPHNAFNTQEALERILQTTLENIRAFSAGRSGNLIPVK